MLLLPLITLLATAAPAVHNGRAGETSVRPPRSAATITVDGALIEPVWRDAAILTGFSQFAPRDGIAVCDRPALR